MANIRDIEGIGEGYATKLEAIGIKTEEKLLEMGGSKKGRETIADSAGVSEKLVLEWVNRADLSRIKGVGSEYADLLEAAGVDSVPELAARRADNLTKKMTEINEAKNLVRRVPTENEVTGWIEHAKSLESAVAH